MKKHLLFILLSVLSIALTSCDEEEESQILFEVESNSNEEDIVFKYFSPDPSCVGKMYYITTNEHSGDLVLRCTNSSNISILNTDDPNKIFSATVTDGNKLNIHFTEMQELNAYSYLNVSANVNNTSKQIAISIERYATK